MKKIKGLTFMLCIAQAALLTACAGNGGTVQTAPAQQETMQAEAAQQVTTQTEAAAQTGTAQQITPPPAQNSNTQITLDEAKQAALADAGLVGSDVIYMKEKLDYEDGIAVYDVEFYLDNMEYEYEINAATGAVYSKSVEPYKRPAGDGQNEQSGQAFSGTYIDENSAKMSALNHAGFAESDVSLFKSEFDIDDGIAVYEIEFYKGNREYEYKINAVDGSVMEYEVD